MWGKKFFKWGSSGREKRLLFFFGGGGGGGGGRIRGKEKKLEKN